MARDTAGVGVYPPRESTSTFTLLAASTSSALAVAGSVLADGLGGGHDVVLVERRAERGPAMAGRPERHALGRVVRVRVHRVVSRHQLGDVDQIFRGRGLSRTGIHHGFILARRAGA